MNLTLYHSAKSCFCGVADFWRRTTTDHLGAEVFRRTLPANRSLEHPAQRDAVNEAAVDAKSNDATRELVHHDCPWCGRET